MKNRVKEFVQKLFLYLNLIAMNMAFGITAYAAGEENKTNNNPILNSTLVQGTINLIKDSVLAVLAIEVVLLGLVESFLGLKYQFGPEEEHTKVTKTMKAVLIVGIIVICSTGGGGLISLVLSYYTKVAAA